MNVESSSVESKHSQGSSNLKQRVVQENQFPGVGCVHQLVSPASHLIDQAFRLCFAMMRTPTDRHHGYPGRLPRNRIQDLYTKHDHGERKIFKIEYLE